ncbi:unnamed protein product [Meloidogyne enterolobii]|uniref:Uncharacterized protein n=1 Tax=Meloidogyne enterolobii TaxID=390850 RepID=A0ACB0ZZK4_MELEN
MDHQYRQRPPSARPSTAAQRRPKTAGRNSERPPSSASSFGPVPPSRQMAIAPSTTVARPQSRIGMVANAIVSAAPPRGYSRAGSRVGTAAGVGVPGTALGNRPLNRSTTAMGPRPGTMSRQMIAHQLPLGTAAAQQRPITQQGVSGARAAAIASRMGSRMGSLAEEQAQELKQLQGLLADYNLVIDRQNTHSDTNLRSLEAEADQTALANQKLMAEVEELFRERRLREEQLQELEQRTERLRTENNERMRVLVNNLELNELNKIFKEIEVKEEFNQVNTEVESLRNEMERKKAELVELTKTKEEMDMALANSPLKRQTMLMEEQLQEMKEKRAQIVAELQSEQTPEEQRDNFIQKIQKDNKEIGHMQEQLQEINERMAQAQEELQEFQNEFELLAGDKSEKFRELKTRGTQMDNFLDNFDESKRQIEGRISALAKQIVRQLQLISLNCRHGEIVTNVTGLDESLLALGSSAVSADELQDLHVRLQEELITLKQNEALLCSELSSMKTKQTEINENIDKMSNIEEKKKEFRSKSRELQAKRDSLKEELSRLEAENERLEAQIKAEESRFGGGGYEMNRLRELKSRVDQIEKERKLLDEKLTELRTKLDYGPSKQRALELRAEYNELLINAVLGRKSVGVTR